ncbi:hypothetical protein [Paraburkholderia antibiotica]|uniref:hypothetical protein n=1 Tax=Paraburkholderia antibiotica TaxID=2728839 RepID=UPI001E299BA9|nr:hypothetical protein [Paraburkholderia antibiotica]
MRKPAVSRFIEAGRTVLALTRVSVAVDGLSSAIAGFALLAGARAFMFFALLGWREPVLGGAGLVLLAMIGWLRWQCEAGVAPASQQARSMVLHASGTFVYDDGTRSAPACNSASRTEAGNTACYNRSSPCA